VIDRQTACFVIDIKGEEPLISIEN